MKTISFDKAHRKAHFDFFNQMNHPHFGVSAMVDIAPTLSFIKETKAPFMPTLLYAMSHMTNEIPELKQRIRNQSIIEHSSVHPSIAVPTKEADVFSFCEVPYQSDFATFIQSSLSQIQLRYENPSFENEIDRDDYIYLSSLPWIHFTNVQHAMHFHPCDSVPRITWGKYLAKGLQIDLPVSLQVHHAIVDGRHVGQFFEGLEAMFQKPESWML